MEYAVKIVAIEPLTRDVKKFTLEKPDGYSFVPGQATEVSINQDGLKENTDHPFTFTSLADEETLEFIIKAYPVEQYPHHAGITEKLHQLNPGDELIIRDPWGTIHYEKPGVFIAGGAGITPFIAIFKQLAQAEMLAEQTLVFSNKTQDDIILEDQLKTWFSPEHLLLTLTREEKTGYLHGRPDEAFLSDHIDNFDQSFYVCGPRPMVKDLKEVLSSLGASTESVVFEA